MHRLQLAEVQLSKSNGVPQGREKCIFIFLSVPFPAVLFICSLCELILACR